MIMELWASSETRLLQLLIPNFRRVWEVVRSNLSVSESVFTFLYSAKIKDSAYLPLSKGKEEKERTIVIGRVGCDIDT